MSYESERSDLEVCCSPREFERKVQLLEQKIESSQRFRSTELKFLRDDAWILAQFAVLKNAEKVRLAKKTERFPDGFVKVNGQLLNVEVTEADKPGRKRGDEYKTAAAAITIESINDADDVARALENAIEKKVRKNYAPPAPTLVVNLNLGVHG